MRVSFHRYPGMDLNGARRKNATRETTSTLKAWLYEHRKNPYPTKGEKIMLAIITKMTLTQGNHNDDTITLEKPFIVLPESCHEYVFNSVDLHLF